MLLQVLWENTFLGTFFSDLFDFNDDAIISWYEVFLVPFGVPLLVFFILMAGLAFGLMKARDSVSSIFKGDGKTETWVRENIKKMFDAMIQAVPVRKDNGKIIVLRGAKADFILRIVLFPFKFPLWLYQKLGGKLQKKTLSTATVFFSNSGGGGNLPGKKIIK